VQALADPVDGILLREAAAAGVVQGPVAVLEDQSGALALGLHELLADAQIRVACDVLGEEEAVAATTSGLARIRLQPGLGPELLAGARLVVLRLPKSLAALDEIAEAVARWADPSVVLLAGGRLKHMSRGMNDVLARHFGAVRASLGVQKSRVLVAGDPVRPSGTRYPLEGRDEELGLSVRAHGAAFAGAGVDLGTRLLLGLADAYPREARRVVDLGCGTGLLAVGAARALSAAGVLAVDESRAAVLSAQATAQANGVADRVEVRRTHLLRGVADRSVDLILCNPPFHRGNTRDSAPAFDMIGEAARTLVPGGELWTVYNSHLPYLRALRRLVGRTTLAGQNPRYTVTRSVQEAG
jgi:16S rRNA (guanine1207-N2)-methyltransferase